MDRKWTGIFICSGFHRAVVAVVPLYNLSFYAILVLIIPLSPSHSIDTIALAHVVLSHRTVSVRFIILSANMRSVVIMTCHDHSALV